MKTRSKTRKFTHDVVTPNATSTTRRATSKADQARASIDKQINQHKDSIRSLKSARNDLAPISVLPPELLSHIFKYVGEPRSKPLAGLLGSEEGIDHLLDAASWKDLNKVLGICRNWRQVALECPSLWSRINFSVYSKRIVEEMISRSKASPLSIRLRGVGLSLDTLSKDLRARTFNIERMQELHLVLSEEQMKKTLGYTSGENASKMQSLIIRIHYNTWDMSQPSSFDISPKVLSMPMPHLRYLDIGECKIQWDSLNSSISQELISLRLSRVSQPSKSSFFGLLSLTPNLEVLYLDSVLPSVSSAAVTKNVQLRRLMSCTIKGSNLSQCLDFHAHVSYPSTVAKLSIRVSKPDEGTFDDDASISSLLSSCGLSVDNPQRSHSNLLLETDSSPNIVLWDGKYEPAPYKQNSANIHHPAVTIDLTRVVLHNRKTSSVLDTLSISGLGMVGIQGKGKDYKADLWLQFFQRHRNVAQIHISCPSVKPILSALSHNSNEKRASGWETETGLSKPRKSRKFTPCLPNLTELTLEDHLDGEMREERGCITDILKKYRKAASAIRNLNLYRCYGINHEDITAFEKSVEKVCWDGLCLPEDEEDSECECEACGGFHDMDFGECDYYMDDFDDFSDGYGYDGYGLFGF